MRQTLANVAVWLLASSIGLFSLPTLAQTKTLRMVPHADVKILDPTFTTAYITRNFGNMIYDTPFGLDAKGVPRPQMVDKYSTSKDGLLWTFTLRPGLKFSDGNAVTAADVVASMQRWTARDSVGRAMTAASPVWQALDARSFTLTLKQPFGMVLEGMAKPSSYPPVVMPERLAKMPSSAPLTEVLGSGPYMFKRDEWVPGNKVVFVRNPHYLARSEPVSGLAGSKKPTFDRVEWLYLPDSNSAIAALKKGEVDYVEQVPPDFITALRSDANVKVGSTESRQALLIMNHLYPPFNNVKVRQALLKAVNQQKFLTAMGYPLDMRVTYCPTVFICGGPNETAVGAEPYRTSDVSKAKQMLLESGYAGEKVVLLVPSDNTYLNAEALMAAQTMRSIGMNVDMQTSDWASITSRRAKRDTPDAGGWNMYATVTSEFDANSPVNHLFLGAACGNSVPGWPCDKQLDELRATWISETVPTKRKQLLDAFQARAFEIVPFINVGQFSPAFAVRKEIKGIDKLWAGLPSAWMLDK